MPLSRGLVISLGVSALSCTLLFLYFRHRITAVENKVNVMFDLIQKLIKQETSDQYYSQNEAQQQTNVNDPNDDTSESQQDNAMNKNTLIEVSDNEDDDEQYHSDDSMSVTDAEDSEDDERKTISLAGAEQISLKQEDIKKIIVPLTTTSQSADAISLPELEELQDSLDELDDDEETSGEEDTVLTDNVGGKCL